MIQSQAQSYDPTIRSDIATTFIALSTVIMAYSYLLSTVPILLFYAMWLPQLFLKKPFILRPAMDLVLPGVFALYCIFTVFWSDYQRSSLIMGLEYASMIVCTMIIVRIVSFDAILKGISIGIFLVLIVLFHTGTFSFDGFFGSKNQVGLYAEIGIFTSLVLFFHLKKKPMEILIFALPSFLLSLLCLFLSHSASSLSSLVLVLAISIIYCMLTFFPQGIRQFFLGLIVLAGATFLIMLMAFNIDLYAEILLALGKSSTLTGRTYLWSEGIRIGMDKFLLGHGYAAFWIGGQPNAEMLWREFSIPGKTGFHFHNVFIQAFVDLGVIGLLLISLMIIGNCWLSLLYILKEGVNTQSIFLLGMSFIFLIRAFVEVDFLGPFGIGVLLFYFTWGRLMGPKSYHSDFLNKDNK